MKLSASTLCKSISLGILLTLACTSRLSSQQWIPPTPEELSMTSIPEVPGAAAVYLNKDESTDDSLHMFSYYVRLKVLTERGLDYANVELPFALGVSGTTIDSIAGRTIHPDGSIVPFTGKPYEKLVGKSGAYQVKAKVFTLPGADVGSILEYRYKIRRDDHYFASPDWIVQTDLYTRKAHYMWRPTSLLLESEDGKEFSSTVAWTPILPAEFKVLQRDLHVNASAASSASATEITLDVHDIAPIPKEEYMPPMGSLSFRVLFYYTHFHTMEDYWKSQGKRWSKDRDKFIGPNRGVSDFAHSLVGPADSQDSKARKLYAAVMQLENTDFSRERTTQEEKAQGLRTINSTDDILTRKRGSGDQLAEVFVGMARAVGLKAYIMAIADRSQRIFLQNYLSTRQLDDLVAVVAIDGKEVFFDPGERYCEPEHLAWKHSLTTGLRQVDSGTIIGSTPGESYKAAHVSRVANLTLDDAGIATGSATLTFTGDPALHWRQEALRGDDTSLNLDLRSELEHMLPGGLEIRVTSTSNLTNSEKPLEVRYSIKGAIGSSTGKRLLVPAEIFQTNEKPLFAESRRELPIDMRYASFVQDAVRYNLPASLKIESAPADDKSMYENVAAYNTSAKVTPNSVTVYRNVTNGKVLYAVDSYQSLKAFYTKLETKDQEPLVLTRSDAAPPVALKAGSN